MRRLKVRGFGSIPKMKRPDALLGGLSGNDFPVYVQHKFDQLSARYHTMHALIGIELEKRRTGKYPDKLGNSPTDPFTAKPLHYQKGTIPVSEPVWNVQKKFFDANTVRSAEGIAVWSLGANGKDDHGLNAYGGGPKGSDDVRAKMIFKKGRVINGPDGQKRANPAEEEMPTNNIGDLAPKPVYREVRNVRNVRNVR